MSDEDEWLCSSSYKPEKKDVVPFDDRRKRKKARRKLEVVVVPTPQSLRLQRVSTNIERLRMIGECTPKRRASEVTSDFGDTPPMYREFSRRQVVTDSPVFVRKVSLKSTVPAVQQRRSPGEIFAKMDTPRRKKSVAFVAELTTDEQKPKEDENSDLSDVSNVFDNITPMKNEMNDEKEEEEEEESEIFEADIAAPIDTQVSVGAVLDLEFRTAFEIQQTQGNETLIDEPLHIDDIETEIDTKHQFVAPLAPFEPDSVAFWKNIDESCAQNVTDIQESYRIETDETVREDYDGSIMMSKNSVAPNCQMMMRKYEDEEEEDLEKSQVIDRKDLTGLAARFASLMSTKSTERKFLLNDLAIGVKSRKGLATVEIDRSLSIYGLQLLFGASSSRHVPRVFLLKSNKTQRSASSLPRNWRKNTEERGSSSVKRSCEAPPTFCWSTTGGSSRSSSISIPRPIDTLRTFHVDIHAHQYIHVVINPPILGEPLV